MDTATIDRLLQPFAKLDEQQLRTTSTYIDLLLKWNARVNLTAVRDPEEMVTRHFGESFFAANSVLLQGPAHRVIDLGSGAGFPGLPFAMLMPHAHVTLIESNQKKATFLKEVIFALGLKNAKVFSGRAEDFPGQADLVAMRAVERFDKALPAAVELTEPNGRIALMIGVSQMVVARDLALRMEWHDLVVVPGGHSRVLLLGTKAVKVE